MIKLASSIPFVSVEPVGYGFYSAIAQAYSVMQVTQASILAAMRIAMCSQLTLTEGLTSYMMRPDGSGKPLTAGDVRQRFANVTRGTDLILVGTPEQIADRLEEHARISGTSGYMLNPLTSPGTLEDFAELVVPALQKTRPLSHSAANRHFSISAED